ncbi:MAG: MFS transporter [Rhodobacteraceae bacterium]|nr:MFS transporter [Paracoccaceae bacterium]
MAEKNGFGVRMSENLTSQGRSPAYELDRFQQLGWAAGAMGTGMMIGAVSSYSLFIMTNLLGIGAALAGALIGVSKFFDVIIDPIIGRISDRADTRWGRRRPFLLAGLCIAPFAFIALFNAPLLGDETMTAAYVLGVLLLIALGTSLFMVPYMTMAAEMTGNYNERTILMSQRVFFNVMGLLTMTVILPQLIVRFGGGAPGYGRGGIVIAILIAVIFFTTFWSTRRAKFLVKSADESYTLKDQLRFILSNRSFGCFIGAKILSFLAQSSLQGTLLLYAIYVLGRDERFLAPFGLGYSAGSVVALPLWAWLTTRVMAKRTAYMISTIGLGCVFLTWLLATPAEPTWVAFARFFVVGVFSTGSMTAGTAMLPDIMELDRRTTGVRQEGFYAAAYTLVENVGSTIGPVLLGLALGATGFISTRGKELADQPEAAITAITMCVSIVPMTFCVLGALTMLGYTVDKELRAATEAQSGNA